jgi:uncharacterized protein (DUF2062 family)
MTTAVIILTSVPGRDQASALAESRQLVEHVIADGCECGYGTALAGAITKAVALGCTHAVVLDVGRSHSPAYLPLFVEAARTHPDAIIVGFRQYQGRREEAASPGFRSPQARPSRMQRLGRWNCDLWTWLETGRWVHDTVYGFKAYPLDLIKDLAIRSRQTDCEVELFAKSIWSGIATVHVPLSSDAASETLAPLAPGEIIRFGITTSLLTLQRLVLPEPLRAMIHRKEFAELPAMQRVRVACREAIAHNCQRPGRFAACVGLGVFFGIVPIWGLQMLAAATTAHLLGLSKPLVLAASHVSSPLTLPLVLYASLVIGHLLLHGQLSGLPHLRQLGPSVLLHSLGEYLIGSTVLAICAGLVAMMVSFVAAATIKRLRGIPSC